MEKGTTYVALDDSKRRIVTGILRGPNTEPELGEIPNDPQHRDLWIDSPSSSVAVTTETDVKSRA
jgi:hypothetical protein